VVSFERREDKDEYISPTSARHAGKTGIVASPHYLASERGLDILKAAAMRVDAAIATSAMLQESIRLCWSRWRCIYDYL